MYCVSIKDRVVLTSESCSQIEVELLTLSCHCSQGVWILHTLSSSIFCYSPYTSMKSASDLTQTQFFTVLLKIHFFKLHL